MVSPMRSNPGANDRLRIPRRDRRYNVRLSQAAGDALDALAAEVDAPPTTVAAKIIEDRVLSDPAPMRRRRPAPKKQAGGQP